MSAIRVLFLSVFLPLLIIACGSISDSDSDSSDDSGSGSGTYVSKTVKFRNPGLDPVVVRVYQCTLADSTLDCPDISVAVFNGSPTDPGMLLPLGLYSFCIQWDLGSGNTAYVNFGWLPGYAALSLSENTSDAIPPLLYVQANSTGYFTGTCPEPVSVP